ncbi:ATP-binding protein [Burkholderia cenocepacia]|uniref:ATP-binding protein n=1 Tax=Burkholderia cenocepacia TaxID=95486 RepID=UPI002DDCF80D|nr:ATP-binding protein [Burkholderia cenocepacia]MEC4775138.1 ATP-binding protein [Burkholderia cenocepacia]
MEVPDNGYSNSKQVYVWARITDIRRFNPFFPFEAAQEIAGEGISLEDTVLSDTRDQLEAICLILGTTSTDSFFSLNPLTYPVKPASTIWHPPAEVVRQLLVGGREEERKALIGTLIARSDVDVTLSAPRLVARHLAILAMAGGGKTVAARRIIRELIALRYPLLILDPHGDYVGLAKCREMLQEEAPGCEIKLFYPELLMQKAGEALIEKVIGQMTDGLTEPQSDFLRSLFNGAPANEGESAIDYIERLIKKVEADVGSTSNKRQIPTMYAVRRSLRIVRDRLSGMRNTSSMMRKSSKLKDLPFEALPNPFSKPEEIIRPGQVSILYLGGYDHVTQCSIAAITLETLFEFRANLSGRIAPFMTVIEEAHTFIPSVRENTDAAVSLPVVRRIITEGRKFGTGLMLISQRPSRLDETIVSQCNSFMILRLVNPRDQTFVRSIMENLSESDARMIPGFGPGQGIISGQVVRFPLPVRVKMDDDLLASEIGDEDFFDQAEAWKPDPRSSTRQKVAGLMDGVNRNRRKSAKTAIQSNPEMQTNRKRPGKL